MLTQLPPALAGLGDYPQFVLYRLVAGKRPGKMDKLPCNYEGRVIDAHDSQHWLSAADACAWASYLNLGVAFVFTERDPFWFLDLDAALQADGQWSPLARQMCDAFAGCAVEVSSSGRGLHIFGTGRPADHGCRNDAVGLEFYTEGRFVALTGTGAVGDVRTPARPEVLQWLIHHYVPARAGRRGDLTDWTDAPAADWRGPTDDEELLRRAMRSQSAAGAFGLRATFADLWTADADALAQSFPSDAGGTGAYNGSSADSALASHLAFWTGKDCARIERLMWRSSLRREKWERDDYLPRTILAACGVSRDVLRDKELVAPAIQPEDEEAPYEPPVSRVVEEATYVDVPAQVELFQDCVYIRSLHRVLTPSGEMLKPEAFRIAFGGYMFVLDHRNTKHTTDAWEAFTQSQCVRHRQAADTCFRPDLPHGAFVRRDGLELVNIYKPVAVRRIPGDPEPFLRHLRALIPDERDRTILLSYFAACVQYKGVKFHWAPVIQGAEGNGKTILSRCVAHAVGNRYVHWPKASRLGAQFNGWMYGKLLYCVEDMYCPKSNLDVVEELKPMITGEDLEIEGKGVDQVTREICGNFILNTNHQNAVRKTRNDRRYAPFFTPQQTESDVRRDGLDQEYMRELFEWLKGEGEWASRGQNYGFAVVSEFLATFPIPPEFNPAGSCRRAPTTTSTAQAMAASHSVIEQHVLEAIEEGRAGFRDGWVSSNALREALQAAGLKLAPKARDDLMRNLRYQRHPLLKDGRPHNPVLPDAARPVLYLTEIHPALEWDCASQIAKAYEDAQRE